MNKLLLTAMVVFTASAVFAAGPATVIRTDALRLLQTLTDSGSANSSPEEFASFKATIDEAEQLYQKGEILEADQFFSLATLKGRLLLHNSLRKSPVAVPAKEAPNPVFTSMSASRPLQIDPIESVDTGLYNPVDNEPYIEKQISSRIIGGAGIYVVKRRETLRLVAARLGVRVKDLARANRLERDATLYPGQKLHYNNRRIVPKSIRNGILVNIPERNLYLFRNGKIAANYPVALGIAKKKESTIWRTPLGRFTVIDKKENPTWRIPLSIRKEMEENGDEVLETVPPGPKNPLGRYAIRTTLAGILIHSTTRPASINSFSSHGCIRVMPEHMEQLFKSVSVAMNGEIIYKPVKIEKTPDGRIFLEVNNDSYEMLDDLKAEVKRVINSRRLENRVSWQKVNMVIHEKSGIAEDVTLAGMPD